MSDPKRWLDDDGDGLPEERRLLRSGLALGPSADSEEALWAALARLGPPGGASGSDSGAANGGPTAGSAAPGGVAWSALGKSLVAIVAVAVVGAAGYVGLRGSGHPPAIARREPAVAPADPPAARAPSPTRPAVDPPALAATDLPLARTEAGSLASAGSRRAEAALSGGVAAQPAPAPAASGAIAAEEPATGAAAAAAPDQPGAARRASTLREESLALDEARAALGAGDAAAALRLLADMDRRFPRGALGQEREVVAIEALARSGQRTAASARAAAFLRAHPASPHAPRIERLADAP